MSHPAGRCFKHWLAISCRHEYKGFAFAATTNLPLLTIEPCGIALPATKKLNLFLEFVVSGDELKVINVVSSLQHKHVTQGRHCRGN